MLTAEIKKVNEDRRLVFGWASVVRDADGIVVDHAGDVILPGDLEDAAVDFMLEHRASGEMHRGGPVGAIVESFVMTPEKLTAMGFPEDMAKRAPIGYWIGVKTNPETFAKVKAGTLRAFSIQGSARRVRVEG